MIELYTAATPNGQKAAIMVEETGLPYETHRVDLGAGEQKTPTYLAINPNGKIPAIIDRDGPGGKPIAVFESGAVLIYLAEKSGTLLPTDPVARMAALQWLMFQVGGIGPMFGQAGFWGRAETKVPAAIDRYGAESKRLLGVLEQRLGSSAYLAGADYSIADIATWPWVNAAGFIGLEMGDCPAVQRWAATIGERDAVKRGMAVVPRAA